MRALFLVTTVALLLSASVATANTALERMRTSDRLVGEGRMKVLFWNVFDAQLHAPGGTFDPDEPFSLSLSYLRNLPGDKIVDKSMEEIAAQPTATGAPLDRWREALDTIIDDVDKGTVITGVRDEDGHSIFYRDDQLVGRIDDPAFTRHFFDIWLGESTSEPGLRRRLLGKN